jgi:hypothetical protein
VTDLSISYCTVIRGILFSYEWCGDKEDYIYIYIYIYIYKANQTLAPKHKEILILSNGHLGVDLLIRKGREYPFFRLVSTLTFYKRKK